MVLNQLKGRLKTARRGHKLLKDKRDELMRQFMDVVRRNKELRTKVEQGLTEAFGALSVASAVMSPEMLEQALLYPRQSVALDVSFKNIMSVNVPVYDFQTKTAEVLNFTLTSPTVLVGMFIGAMLTFVFSAFTMSAVQTAAQSIVVEVRRQFKEIKGIMEYKADPDYGRCVTLCTKGALHEMVAPALLAIIVPIVTGLILGTEGVVGLLGGVSVCGFAMAVFMSNAGGAWDNAKKYIEGGHNGGKGSDAHKAAVVGDTVGDPFKDTSGPSINILIKLMTVVSLVFAPLFIQIGGLL